MATFTVTNPYNQHAIKELNYHSSEEVENAIQLAHDTFQQHKNGLPAHQRIAILERVVEIMSSQVEALTQLAASEGGKPYMDSKVEVLRAINGVKLAMEHIPHIKGEQIPMGQTESSTHRLAFSQREPIGVVTSISAFNHPLNLIVHQTVPAIAVGCPVLIKPALQTPLSCLRFVEILYEAGLPKQWCQAILSQREDSEKLATDARINFLSFIGSGKVGWMLRSKLSPGTRCALEHGGAAPVIVDASADMEAVLDSVSKGGFYHAGQVCVSVQRVYVPRANSQAFAQGLAERARNMIVGDPLDEKTEVGPLINPGEVSRVAQWVQEAVDAGAELLSGGKAISDSCYAPTVLLNPPADAMVSTSEIFGPVVCVYAYDDKQEAIDRANGLDFAFQAAVYTNDLEDAINVSQQLNATAVMVNDHTAFRVDWMPFGGRDVSGIGMGGIQYSMHEMTREKMLVLKSAAIV